MINEDRSCPEIVHQITTTASALERTVQVTVYDLIETTIAKTEKQDVKETVQTVRSADCYNTTPSGADVSSRYTQRRKSRR
jgi:DNA-binding FrmR family transcriptional regulator